MTYAQALAEGNKAGWKHAKGAAITAAYSESLAAKWCLRPEAVYAWATKHRIDLSEHVERMHADDSWIWDFMLKDLPYGAAR